MSEQKKDYSTMTAAELAEDDAKTEAEYAKAVAATKRLGKLKRGRRYIGCPWEFLVDVCRLPHKHTILIVALLVYRQTKVEAAGIVRLCRLRPGQKTEVTLLWRPTSL